MEEGIVQVIAQTRPLLAEYRFRLQALVTYIAILHAMQAATVVPTASNTESISSTILCGECLLSDKYSAIPH
jgi:hypothetical protein